MFPLVHAALFPINVGYYLCILPFRISFNKRCKTFYVTSPLYRKIVVGVLHLIMLVMVMWIILLTIVENGAHISIVDHALTAVAYAIWGSHLLTILHVFWFRHDAFCQLFIQLNDLCIEVNSFHSPDSVTSVGKPGLANRSGHLLSSKIWLNKFMVVQVVLFSWLLLDICLSNVANQIHDSSHSPTIERYCLEGSLLEILKCVFSFFTFNYGLAIVQLGSLLTRSTIILPWFLVSKFVTSARINENNLLPVEKSLDAIEKFGNLFETVGLIFGYLVAQSSLGFIPSYAQYLPFLFQGTFTQVIETMSYIARLGAIILPAASIHWMLKCLPHALLKKNQRSVSTFDKRLCFRMHFIAQQTSSDALCLRFWILSVTFAFVGQVCSLVTTYALIIAEFRQKST